MHDSASIFDTSAAREPMWSGRRPWCGNCPLRSGKGFADFSEPELAFMTSFKIAHTRASAGETIIAQGETAPKLMTLFPGWALRTRNLSSGERAGPQCPAPGRPVWLANGALRLLGTCHKGRY